MKIAVPVRGDGHIDNHFGHCELYHVFTISDENRVVEVENVASPQGCGCKSDIAQTLASQGVSVLLAGGIGNGAVNVLNSAGIDVVRGCSGKASENVMQYVVGSLIDSGENCGHHDHHHEHGHTCSH